MDTVPDFDKLAISANAVLRWARKKITNPHESTGTMSFVATFRFEHGRMATRYLEGMGLIRELNTSGQWWIDASTTVTVDMMSDEYHRQIAALAGEAGAQLQQQIKDLERQLQIQTG